MDQADRKALVAVLNEALTAELKAVRQYGAHAQAITDLELSQGLSAIMQVEQEHAHALVARIEALGGQPAVDAHTPSPLSPTNEPAAVAEMLRADLTDELVAIKQYATALADMFLSADDQTLDLLQENLGDELRHARWLRDRVQSLIAQTKALYGNDRS